MRTSHLTTFLIKPVGPSHSGWPVFLYRWLAKARDAPVPHVATHCTVRTYDYLGFFSFYLMLGLDNADNSSIMGDMTTQWMILRRWAGDGHLGSFVGWQPACQLTFDTRAEAEEHKTTLEPDFPDREFKVIEQK